MKPTGSWATSRVRRIPVRLALAFGIAAGLPLLAKSQEPSAVPLATGAGRFVATHVDGGWGVALQGAGQASAAATAPLTVMLSSDPPAAPRTAPYRHVALHNGSLTGTGELKVGAATITFDDNWTVVGNALRLDRQVTVHGSTPLGYATAILFEHSGALQRNNYEVFVPGMIYGGTAHLTPAAIGGSQTFGVSGQGASFIREDRMPAPLYAIRFRDGSTMAVLDPKPNGATTPADSHDTQATQLTDAAFAFGSLGGWTRNGHLAEGFWFPGSEGEVTYQGNTYPGGQLHRWRYRFHPLVDGAKQHYTVEFRVGRAPTFPLFQRDVWRWAYTTLAPVVPHQDIAAAERSVTSVLLGQAVTVDDRTGVPNESSAVSAAPISDGDFDRKAILGFTGKNLEAAELLLLESDLESDSGLAVQERQTALAIFHSFLALKVAPPAGEGFLLKTGEPALALPSNQCVYLRSFGDDMKAMMRAYLREQRAGRSHPDWLSWGQSFADWLLTQQSPNGAFPRSWVPGTGAVLDPSPQSSYNAVPFLVLLTKATGDGRYRAAAERAADFSWTAGQAQGQFVGGTIDNPDILDKEAGTLSLEAYLALYGDTHQRHWLDRAIVAAAYAESYIYLWNVPTVPGEDAALLGWKPGASTVGTQLIATGHSLVDDYMAFDVDSYARLYKLTGDTHYRAVAELLLHGTKAMVATPDHLYDLRGPGWQQEHWSFAPPRGMGLHRLWLPWVATSQLRGIVALREDDPALFIELTAGGMGP